MAASFGEKLLAEVSEERLHEVLHDLRRICHAVSEDATSGSLGVKPLDDLLEVFMAGPGARQGHADHDENSNPQPVVEISSTASAAGKSQLLYYLTAIAILPSTLGDTRLNGRDAAVVFIDTDGRFDADRLRSVARGIVRQKLQAEDTAQLRDAIENMLINSLQHVHVFRPESSISLLATLQSLEPYLFDLSRHISSDRPLQAILIDSATAFFWQDKLRDQVARIEEIGRPQAEIERARSQKESFYMADMYAELVRELKRLQRVFGCAVVYTTTAWVGRSTVDPAGSRSISFRSSLPAPWGLFPALRLVVCPFPPATAQDARLGRFVGYVNGLGREAWSRRVIEGMERRDKGTFVFYTGRDGVEMYV